MVVGTRRAHWLGLAGKELKGLAAGARLVREGLAVVTKANRFMLKQYDALSIPPMTQVEDTPEPGFIRMRGLGI